MPNVDLLNRAITKIQENPDRWDQNNWARAEVGPDGQPNLDTAKYCLAGWIVVLNGAELAWLAVADSTKEPLYFIAVDTVDNSYIPTYARAALGLSQFSTGTLFGVFTTIAEMIRVSNDNYRLEQDSENETNQDNCLSKLSPRIHHPESSWPTAGCLRTVQEFRHIGQTSHPP